MVNHPNRSKRDLTALHAARAAQDWELTHPLLNNPFGERHLRALRYIAEREYAGVRSIGHAAGDGTTKAGKPLNELGASKHGGRIANDLSRLGLVRPFRPYNSARFGEHYAATPKGHLVAREEKP